MKVAFLTHYPELYGANRSLLDLVLQLRSKGRVEPFVISPRPGPIDKVLQQHGITHAIFEMQPWMSERKYMGRIHHRIMQHRRYEKAAKERMQHNVQLLPNMVRWVAENSIDLLHANSAVVGLAPELAKATSVPLVWHIRELPEHQYLLHLDKGKRGYGKALRSAERTIAISKAVQQDMLEYIGRPWPIPVISNGILPNARYAELRAATSDRWTDTTPFVLAMIGLIHPSKGQLEAVEALSILKKKGRSVKMLVAGTGRDKELKQRITDLGLDASVNMLGFVDDPFAVLSKAHALLMCSRNEAMGRVTVEAMASCIPVVGHASGGTIEIIQDKLTGLIYNGGAKQLASCIDQLVQDPEQAKAMGLAGSLNAEENYSIERYADQVWEVFHSAGAKAPASS